MPFAQSQKGYANARTLIESSTTAEPTHDARGYQAEDDVRAAKPWKHFEPWGSVIEALGGSRVVAEQLHVTVDAMSSQANQQ